MQKETGLLSVLPKPENEISSKVSSVFKFSSKLIPAAAKTAATSKVENKTTNKPTDPSEDDEDIGSDFFCLSKNDTSEDVPMDINIDLPEIKSDKMVTHFPQRHPSIVFIGRNDDAQSEASPEDTDSSHNLKDLDEEMVKHYDYVLKAQCNFFVDDLISPLLLLQVQKICGRKRKGQIPENIQFIDINEAEILAESKKVAEKHFTDEVMCNPAPKKFSSSSSKRKHQITYLAFQVSNWILVMDT